MTTKIRPSTLENTAVSAGTYGGTTQHSVFTVDAQGRLTYAANATPNIATSQLWGTISASQMAASTDPTWLTITKSKVGLGNVDNTADANKSVSYASTAGSAPASDVYSWAKQSTKPSYTKSEVGLGSVDNTADSSKSVNYAASAGGVAWSNVSSKPTLLVQKNSVPITGVINSAPGNTTQSSGKIYSQGAYSVGVPVIELAFDYWTYWTGYEFIHSWWITQQRRGQDSTGNYVTVDWQTGYGAGPHVVYVNLFAT